jgi:hypothetical protein
MKKGEFEAFGVFDVMCLHENQIQVSVRITENASFQRLTNKFESLLFY